MKKNLLLFLLSFLMGAPLTYAALPDGSNASDWTLIDLNGATHNLYSVLDQGKPAVIDFSATWCGPCWNYHNTGNLESLWDQYGPSGSNQIMVYFIEPDMSTNTNCLYGSTGCVGGTQGNWVSGTGYPIIDLTASNGPNVGSQYNVTYYPTLYGISPDKRTWEVGQASVSTWANWLFQSFNMDASATVNPSICGDNGSITINTIGGYGTKTYSWSHGGNGATASGLAPGNYEVRITDQNGYFIDRSYVVTGSASGQPVGMQVQSITNVDCSGNSTGTAEVVGTFGNYGYSYLWSNGDTGPEATNLPAGTHSVLITDAEGCEASFDITVDEPDPLSSIPVTVGDQCNAGFGEVSFVSFGGVEPYYFDIGTGPEPTSTFTNLTAGFYAFVVTDDNNCEYTGSFEILVEGVPVAMAAPQGSLDCNNTTVVVSGAGSSTNVNQFSYEWTTTNGNIVSSPNQLNITVDAPGDYTLVVTNNAYNCTESATTTVISTGLAPIASAASPSQLSCNVNEVTLSGAGSSTGPEYTYSWSTTNGTIVSGGSTLTPTVSAVGTYTLQVTNTANGCIKTSDVMVDGDFSTPAITATGTELTCTTTSAEICATVGTGVTVTWNTPNGPVNTSCLTVESSGTYTAIATGANGCTSTAQAVVTQSADLPQTSITAPETITCTVPQITLNGTLAGDPAEHTIIWSTTNGNIVSGGNTLTPVVDQAGTYTMKVTNIASGCVASNNTMVESTASLPVAGFTSTLVPGTITLTSTSLNSTGDITWTWGNQTSTGATVNATFDETGVYTICATATNECGSDTECTEVQFVSVMISSFESNNVKCFGDNNGTLSASPQGGLVPYTVSWTGPNGFASTDWTISDLAPGTYVATVKDAFTNEIIESFDITEPTALVQTSTVEDVKCFNGNDGAAEIMVTGGSAPYNIDANGVDLSMLAAGTYPIVITDDNGCTTNLDIVVTQPEELVINSSDVELTQANANTGSITITVSGGTGNINVTWDNGMTGTSITGLGAGTYTPTLTDDNGCSVTLDPITVGVISDVTDLSFVSSFKMSPNPASSFLAIDMTFNGNIDGQLFIRDSAGKLIMSHPFDNIASYNRLIDVTNFNSGMYMLTIVSEGQSASQRFIVVK